MFLNGLNTSWRGAHEFKSAYAHHVGEESTQSRFSKFNKDRKHDEFSFNHTKSVTLDTTRLARIDTTKQHWWE